MSTYNGIDDRLQCPKCGQRDLYFTITVSGTVAVDEPSLCQCENPTCEHKGCVADFKHHVVA